MAMNIHSQHFQSPKYHSPPHPMFIVPQLEPSYLYVITGIKSTMISHSYKVVRTNFHANIDHPDQGREAKMLIFFC